MSLRQSAIEKIEAWARWELGSSAKPESVTGQQTPGFIPGDQADHMTVEIALNDFSAPQLKPLLLHVYGRDMLPDSFEPFEALSPIERVTVRAFLKSFGFGSRAFTTTCLRRFTRFLGERLGS